MWQARAVHDDLVLSEIDGHLATVTLNRPAALNAMTTALRERFHTVVEALERDPAVWVVIFTGAGDRAFSAGADLKERNVLTEQEMLDQRRISPGKTVEGFFGGYLGTLAGFFLFWLLLENDLALWKGIVLTMLVGIAGPIGDLSESLIKRSFHVKDSGNIIPGHGGMLDRIDALLFTAPVVYFFAAFAR